jgi:putative intracellular protease/amidase
VLRLREAGLAVDILGASAEDTVRSELGYPVIPSAQIAGADGADYGVVVVPGGAAGRALASDLAAVALVSAAVAGGGRVLTVGTGSELAVAAGVRASACKDADGLPDLMRELTGGSEK